MYSPGVAEELADMLQACDRAQAITRVLLSALSVFLLARSLPSLVGQKYPTTVDRRLARPDCCSREIIGHFSRTPRRREARGTSAKSAGRLAGFHAEDIITPGPEFPPYLGNGNAACENVQHAVHPCPSRACRSGQIPLTSVIAAV